MTATQDNAKSPYKFTAVIFEGDASSETDVEGVSTPAHIVSIRPRAKR